MRYPDWKAFESGEMTSVERAEAERLLREDEGARQDFGAYLEYKSVLRQAMVSEMPDTERLEAIWRVAVPRTSGIRRFPIRWNVALAAALFATTVILMAVVVVNNLTNLGPAYHPNLNAGAIASLQTNDPVEAAQLVRSTSNIPAPAYHLTGLATLKSVCCCRDWGAYEYEVDGKPYRLVIRRRGYAFKNCGKKIVGRTTFYVGQTVGWECPRCAYELSGGEESTRWKIALAAAKEQFGTL